MNNKKLKIILDKLDECIDDELCSFFNNSSLKSLFSLLVQISVLDDGCFDKDVVDLLDVLTDNLDSLNFGVVRENIVELKDLL